MKVLNALMLACAGTTIQAFELPSLTSVKRSVFSLFERDPLQERDGGGGNCPAIWTTVSSDLTAMFLSNGQCNDDARAALRANFHVSTTIAFTASEVS